MGGCLLGCLLPFISLVVPRIALAGIWLSTDWLSRSYDSATAPLLGFVFFPWTTIVYMSIVLNNDGVVGEHYTLVAIAFVFDLLGQGVSFFAME